MGTSRFLLCSVPSCTLEKKLLYFSICVSNTAEEMRTQPCKSMSLTSGGYSNHAWLLSLGIETFLSL